jgi:LytS/YehU family sensor histidine kinase
VINLMVMAVLEAAVFYRQSRLSRLKNEKLMQELSEIRFEMLKTQINPHFLFNSLNVLSGLIDQDTRRAQSFIEAFAKIYHYVLETIEKQVVSLDEELKFARSYIYLQQIRHGDQILFSVNLSAESLRMMLPPLSLQIVLENAFKHNAIRAGQPLAITLNSEGHWLVIRNALLPRQSVTPSTGIGQRNLSRRYAMICGETPHFGIENNQYLVKLPLLPCEN